MYMQFKQVIYYSGKEKGGSMTLFFTMSSGGCILSDYYEDDYSFELRERLERSYIGKVISLPILTMARAKAIEYASRIKNV